MTSKSSSEKNHQAVVKIRNRMDDVRQSIANEQKRIAGSFGKEYQLARARYDELTEAVSQSVSSEGANSNKQAKLRELEGTRRLSPGAVQPDAAAGQR